MLAIKQISFQEVSPVVEGAPIVAARLALLGSGRIQRSLTSSFQTLEWEWDAYGPSTIDVGPQGLGLPLDGRPRYWRLINGKQTSKTVQAPTPTLPAVPAPSGPFVEVAKAPVAAGWTPTKLAVEPLVAWGKQDGRRVCSTFGRQTLDVLGLAQMVYASIPIQERDRLDRLVRSRFPTLGYRGLLVEWWLTIAWDLPTEPLFMVRWGVASKLTPLEKVALAREGKAGKLQLVPQLARTPLRVAFDWGAGRMWPTHQFQRPGMPGSLYALEVARQDPLMVAYTDYVPDGFTVVGDVPPLSGKRARGAWGVLLQSVMLAAKCPEALDD